MENKNPLGMSPCYCCGVNYNEADDWAIFNSFNSPEESAVLICPNCLRKTDMVLKYRKANEELEKFRQMIRQKVNL